MCLACNDEKKNEFLLCDPFAMRTMGPLTLAKRVGLSTEYRVYTWLSWDRCEPCLAWLWTRAEQGLHSTVHHLLSGTELWSASIANG